jgi:hypothetical protein|tara:strand:+ start:363 stop:575 length:213 start_codon:yes stop_codon:yes gene_type:complete
MKPIDGEPLHKYYGCEEYSCRSAFIHHQSDGAYTVECFIDNKLEKLIVIKDKSEYYVEDAAENWVTGVGL